MGETVQNLQSMLKAKDIKTGTLERIAKASGIPLAEFLGHDNDVNYQSGVNTDNTTANASEFIQEIKAQRESYESMKPYIAIVDKLKRQEMNKFNI